MASRATRAAFFIFDPTLVPESARPTEEESSDAKIIYYSPSSACVEEKRSQVGLLEGLIGFTALFSGEDGPMKSMRTKQYVFSVLEAEPHTWLRAVRAAQSPSPPSLLCWLRVYCAGVWLRQPCACDGLHVSGIGRMLPLQVHVTRCHSMPLSPC